MDEDEALKNERRSSKDYNTYFFKRQIFKPDLKGSSVDTVLKKKGWRIANEGVREKGAQADQSNLTEISK